MRAPWSVYLGWITVATIANIAQTLAATGFDGFGLPPTLLAAAVLAVGLAIAATFVTRFRDVAYGLVIVWAYLGVVVNEQDAPPVVIAAGLGAAIVAVLVVLAFVRGRGQGAGRRLGLPATV